MKHVKIKATIFLTLSALFVTLLLQGYHLLMPLQKEWQQFLLATSAHGEAFSEPASFCSGEGILGLLFLGGLFAGSALQMVSHSRRWCIGFFGIFLLGTGSLLIGLLGKYVDPVPYQAFLLVLGVMITLFLQTKAGWRQPQLQQILGARLSRRQLKRVINSDLSPDFLGKVMTGSLLVVSLANHRELQERMLPEEYVSMINFYLEMASDFLVDVGGYLDHCSADNIRVLFDIPLPEEVGVNHGLKAVKTALDLMVRIDELNRQCDSRWQQRLDVRIAINSGKVIAAAYGGVRLGHYSVAGPVVDFTDYLAAVGLSYGARILVGPKTYQMAQEELEFRPVDRIYRPGVERYWELYEVLSEKGMLSLQREKSRDYFCQGVIHFRQQEWDEAINAFSEARIHGLPDLLLDLYLERVVQLRQWEDQKQGGNNHALHYTLLG